MARFLDLPIRQKLVVVGWMTSLSALIVSCVVFVISAYFIGRANALIGSDILASIIAENLTTSVLFDDRATAGETIRSLRATPTVNLVCVYNANGILIAQLAKTAEHGCPVSPPPDQRAAAARTLTVVRPIVATDKRAGTLYLESNVVRLTEQLRLQGMAAAVGGLAGLLIATLVAARMHSRIAQPIISLSATAAGISRGGSYAVRATKSSNDEVGRLVDAFNDMLSGIEKRDEELRAANQMKDEFLAALSHEMRTPMNAIFGWLQILRTSPKGADVADEAIARIERNARVQARLVEDLLDISRIISGKMDLKLVPTDLTQAALASVEALRPSAEAKHIDLRAEVPDTPCMVSADPVRLQQVVGNILSNAVKFTAEKGTILLRVESRANEFRLSVTDSGIGISKEFLPRVFDRFRQADGSITRQYGGLGLGMAIAHDLVKLHGGTLEAESGGPGMGATFTMTLPALLQREGISPASVASGTVSLNGLRVLVVDDDDDARRVAAEALTGAGARVVSASNGEDAMKELASQEFDAFVFDVQMPAIDGFALLKLARQLEWEKGRFTPAVAVTAHAYAADQSQARAAGFQRVVVKPYEFSALKSAIADSIRS
jgi:signal transduction histidine kinase